MKSASFMYKESNLFTYYVCYITSSRWPPSLRTPCLKQTHKIIKKTRGSGFWHMEANFIQNSTFRLLDCVWEIHVYAFFQVSLYEKTRDWRSGDRTDHRVPDIYIYIYINSLHPTLTRYISNDSLSLKRFWNFWRSFPYRCAGSAPTRHAGQKFILKCVIRLWATLYLLDSWTSASHPEKLPSSFHCSVSVNEVIRSK